MNKMDVFELIENHLEGGTLHLPSVFDYEDNYEEFAGIIGVARKKGVTVVFDNENEVFEAVPKDSVGMENLRLVSWSAYFMMNKLHAKHYMKYLEGKENSIIKGETSHV